MAVEPMDILGVLAMVAYLAGVGAVTLRMLILRRWQAKGKVRGGVFSAFLFLLGTAYILLVALDASSVVTVLTNGVDDIPPSSTLRTALIAAWMWVVWVQLARLAYGKVPE